MPLPKPTYKKPREQINSFEESTWHANDTPFYETEQVAVFKDLYPCTEGHLIPRKDGDIKNGQKGNGIRLSFPNGDHKEYY